MRELRSLFVAVYGDWTSLMGGIGGILLSAIAASGWEPLPSKTFWIAAAICLLAAFFRVWHGAFRAAHPYSEETYRHVKTIFDSLTDTQKLDLERLAIQKWTAQLEGGRIESTGFVTRDFATGRLSLHPDFELIVPRLVKEWRASADKFPLA